MNIAKPIIFRYLFKAFLTVCVMCMVAYWFYKFDVEDRDIGVVDYISFEADSRIRYPVASLCFELPFSREKISRISPDLNITNYLGYLEGEYAEPGFQDIDYSSITLDLDDYLNSYTVTLRNGTDVERSQIATFSHKNHFNGFSEWGWFFKCFELNWDISHHGTVRESNVVYNRSKLLLDSYSLWSDSPWDIQLYIHYPGQFLLAPNDLTYFKIHSNPKALEVTIEDVEILRSRNSKNRRCTTYDDKVSFDDMVRSQHVIKNGCILPYFRPLKHFSKCETRESIKSSAFRYQNVRTKYYPMSCHRLSKVSYRTDYYDNELFGYTKGDLDISIIYPQYFRSIELTKEVDVHSLIGNIGGYVGLFLGNCIERENYSP